MLFKKKGMKAISFKNKTQQKKTRNNKACFVTNLDELNNAGSTARSTHGTRTHGGNTGVRLTRRPSPCESVAKSRKWGQPIKKNNNNQNKANKEKQPEPTLHSRRRRGSGRGKGAGLRWLASLAAHIHHEHKCETVPKISDQVASCSRYDSRQKKKMQKGKKKNQRRRRSRGELRNNELQCQDNCKTRCDIYPCT